MEDPRNHDPQYPSAQAAGAIMRMLVLVGMPIALILLIDHAL